MTSEQGRGASSDISMTELLKQKRAEARAAAAERAARSPPAISPKLTPLPHPDAATQLLPVWEIFESFGQNSVVDPALASDHIVPSLGDIICRPDLSSNDHIVLLPIASMVRQVYEATVKDCRHEIRSFLNGEQTEIAILRRLDAMIERLKLLTDHQDLIMDNFATQETSDDLQSKWAETCSSKCLFLRELLDSMRSQEKHIAIFAQPGHMLDILEVLLRVHKFAYRRVDRLGNFASSAMGDLRITLLPTTSPDGGQYVVNPADAVIAFDNTFRPSELGMIRNRLSDSESLSPLIYLVVANSMESVGLCLSKALGPMERRLFLIQYITQTVSTVGILDPDLPEPEQAAAAVAGYLANDLEENPSWPLPANDVFLRAKDRSKMLMFQPYGSATQAQTSELNGIILQGATKRAFGIDATGSEETDSTKRMRMTPAPVEESFGSEIKHFSNSVDYLTKADTVTESSLRGKTIDPGSQLRLKEGIEADLRRLIGKLEADLEDQKKTIKRIQPKFVRAINERGRFESERDVAKLQVVKLTERVESGNAEISKLKEMVEALTTELETAKKTHTNFTVPEATELARAQADITALREDKERLEKRISSMKLDFDFTRESYQKASSAAAEFSNEISALKQERENLERKASENIIRLAEIQRSNESKEREARIEELEALLMDREFELWKKREELKVRSNGRRETRSTSVPQSPRMGSGTLSPRLQYGRATSRSRQNSPVPGEGMRENYRDSVSFPQLGPRVRGIT